MAEQDDDLDALSSACDRDLGDPDLWYHPDGYPDSFALCIVDSIYSTGAHYSSVINVVSRYRDDRAKRDGDADSDGTVELLANITDHGGPDGWASTIGNRRPTSTSPGALLKAQAIREIAEKLTAMDISTCDSLRAAFAEGRLATAQSAWTTTPGQRSGITWEYALMLAGIPGVKADRIVVRYVARALGRVESAVSPSEASALVRRLADQRNWDLIRTDHAIWRFESGRQVNREGDPVDPGHSDSPPTNDLPAAEAVGRGLATIAIEAISAPGVRYEAVAATLTRYREYSADRGRNGDSDGINELIGSFDDLGGAEKWAAAMGNQRIKTCGGTDRLVAEIILDAAHRLHGAGVHTVSDLQSAAAEGRLGQIEALWRSAPPVKGQECRGVMRCCLPESSD